MVWDLQNLKRRVQVGGPTQISSGDLLALLDAPEGVEAILGEEVSESVRGQLEAVGLQVTKLGGAWYVAILD